MDTLLRSPRFRRALTLAEAVVSMVIVSTLLVAALTAAGGVRLTEQTNRDRVRGIQLAQDLLAEIMAQPYEDPDHTAGTFGLGSDEVGDGSRALWEDVDDYDGWSASPPEEKDGTPLTGFEGWERRVAVAWVSPGEVDLTVSADQRVKRITVTVLKAGGEVAELSGLRCGDVYDARNPHTDDLDVPEDKSEVFERLGGDTGLDWLQIRRSW